MVATLATALVIDSEIVDSFLDLSAYFLGLLALSSSKVACAPVGEARVFLCRLTLLLNILMDLLVLGLLVDCLDLVLSRGRLRTTHLLVVPLVDRGELAWALIRARSTHLLPHHLRERTAGLGHLEGAFRLLGLLICELLLHDLNVGWRESALRVRLPLGEVQHFEL